MRVLGPRPDQLWRSFRETSGSTSIYGGPSCGDKPLQVRFRASLGPMEPQSPTATSLSPRSHCQVVTQPVLTAISPPLVGSIRTFCILFRLEICLPIVSIY